MGGNVVSQQAFADMQGWSKSHVTALKQSGRLVTEKKGKRDMVLVAESLARIKATADPNRQDVADRHEQNRHTAERDVSAPASGMDERRVSSTYQQSRAVKERYLALQAKAEYELRIGKLIDVEVAKKAGFDLGMLLRTSLENLQDQLTSELAPETDPAKIYELLGEHFEYTLSEISRKLNEALVAK